MFLEILSKMSWKKNQFVKKIGNNQLIFTLSSKRYIWLNYWKKNFLLNLQLFNSRMVRIEKKSGYFLWELNRKLMIVLIFDQLASLWEMFFVFEILAEEYISKNCMKIWDKSVEFVFSISKKYYCIIYQCKWYSQVLKSCKLDATQ